MNRTIALVALMFLLVGCTRYSTRANGPFARKQKTDPFAAIPPGPAANNSPLALGSNTQPEPPQPPGADLVIPPRSGGLARGADQSAPAPAGEIIPAGGFPPTDDAAAFPPKRRPEPQPGQLPSPFASKEVANTQPMRPGEIANTQPMRPAVESAQASFARHMAEIKKLTAAANEKWNTVDTYESVVTRRELSPAKVMTEDVVFYQFRKNPMAVYIRNIGETSKGREILYNPTQHEDKIYAIVGQGDSIFMKMGSKAPAVTPDSPFVKDKSRYSIREAGYATPINRVAGWTAKAEAGKIPADAMTYLGPVTRPEFQQTVSGVQLKLRPGDDPLLPNGGVRHWFYDRDPDSPSYGLQLLIIATEANGKEVEYYLFEKLKFNIKYPDADFSPDRFNKKK